MKPVKILIGGTILMALTIALFETAGDELRANEAAIVSFDFPCTILAPSFFSLAYVAEPCFGEGVREFSEVATIGEVSEGFGSDVYHPPVFEA